MDANKTSLSAAAVVELLVQVLRLTILVVIVGWVTAVATGTRRADVEPSAPVAVAVR